MTKKSNIAPKLKTTATILQSKAADFNEELFNLSEEFIESAIETGSKVQDIMEKAVKNGTKLFGKQQELALDTFEVILVQHKTGMGRLQKLVGIDKKTKAKAKKTAKNSIKKKRVFLRKAKPAVKKTPTIDDLLESALTEDKSQPLSNTKKLIKS